VEEKRDLSGGEQGGEGIRTRLELGEDVFPKNWSFVGCIPYQKRRKKWERLRGAEKPKFLHGGVETEKGRGWEGRILCRVLPHDIQILNKELN